MEAILETIPRSAASLFFCKVVNEPYFGVPYHFHPELEFLLVNSGYGMLYVGNGFRPFQSGDVAIIGSNIPHWWTCHEDFYQPDSTLRTKAVCVQFPPEILGHSLLKTVEARPLRALMDRSCRGIFYHGETRAELGNLIPNLPKKTGVDRLILFLQILSTMQESTEYEYIRAPDHQPLLMNSQDTDRLNTVFNFVTRNYAEDIDLAKVSNLVNLSPQSFCRFFKSRTDKVFSQYLNEIRIGKACEFLLNPAFRISEVCFMCGYNQLSNFNRQFKRIKGVTPREFRQLYAPR